MKLFLTKSAARIGDLMNYRLKTFAFFTAVLLCTFVLSYCWEHGGEEIVSELLGLPYDAEFESAEQWRFILTAIGFSAFSLLIPTFAMHHLLSRLMRSNRHLEDARANAVTMAMNDALTGLANRRGLNAELEIATLAVPDDQRCHALLVFDLDKFKSVNDIYGHSTGDALLKEVGARLQVSGLEKTFIARLGGDEFACLALNLKREMVALLADAFEVALNAPYRISGREHFIGVSIGVACFPEDGQLASELMRRADIALYRAKARDLPKIEFFDISQEENEKDRVRQGEALRAALLQGKVVPHYQPIVNLVSGETVGFEALARWVDGDITIPPSVFIPLAEELSLINDLSMLILRQACKDAASWPTPMTVSVNLSPILLKKQSIGLTVHAILAETGLAADRLTIEITENMFVEDLPIAAETFAYLRRVGVKLALDDFGTGFSSIHHLKELRFDSLKIDKSYVSSLGDDGENDAIVRSMLTLANALHMKVVAEGIEEHHQLAWLRAECNGFGQGYLFGKPIPFEVVGAHLSGHDFAIAV